MVFFFVLFRSFSDPVLIYLLIEKSGQDILPKFTFCVLQKQVCLIDSEQHEGNKVNHFWLNCPFKGKM